MTSGGDSPAERNDTVNKKQTSELAELQTKWNMDCATAIENPIAYILKRSREDYIKVMGSESGLPSYQADILAECGVGTHDQVAMTERAKLAESVMSAFNSVPDNTIVGLLGQRLVEDLLGSSPVEVVPQALQLEEPSTTTATVSLSLGSLWRS